ncbi:hypothetical protein OROMI_024819 [Orobanche minor]
MLTYIKSPRNGSVCYFSSKLDVPSNVVQKKRVARVLFFKIWSSQGILKVRDCTPMEAEDILTYIKSPRNGSKRVARILFFKIRSSQEILKIRDGTPLEAEEMLTYIKSPRNGSVCYFSSKLDVPSNVVQKKRVARILFFKIRPSQNFLKIRDGTPLRGGGNFYIHKSPRNGSVCYFSSKLDVPSNVVQKKRVARILFFKIRPSQKFLKIRDGTPLRVARVLFFKIWSSQGILKVRDCTPMEAEDILTYIKSPRNGSKRVARILFFKIRSSQEILKIRDGTPLEAEEMLTYIKSPRNGSVCYFSSKLDVPSNVVQKKRVARILFFKIRPSQKFLKIRDGTPLRGGGNFYIHKKPSKRIESSQEILKIRDGTPLEAEEMLTYIKALETVRPSQNFLKIRDGTPLRGGGNFYIHKSPRNGSVCYFFSKLDVPSNVVQKKRVARILFFKIRPSQKFLKVRDGILEVRDCTPMEAEDILTYIKSPRNGSEMLTYIKSPRNGSVCYFSSKLDVPSNVVQKKRVARILFFKIRPSQKFLKIRDGTPLREEKSGTDSVFKIRSSQEILKIRDGTPLEAEEMLTYIKSPRNGSVCYFSSKLDVPSNVVQKKRVARILFFKIRPSQNFLKIRDGTPLRGGGNFYIHKSPRNGSVCYFFSKLDVPSNVVQKKRVARILFFKIRPSQKFLKVRDGTPLRSGGNFYIHKKPSQRIGILEVRDCTPMEAEDILTYIKSPRNGSEMLTYIKSPRNGSVCYFSSKLDVPSNVVQKKRVARILFFKIRPSQKFLKIRDEEKSGTDSVFKIRSSQEILKIRDGTPLEAEEMLTYIKSPRNGSVCYFSSKLDVPSNVVQKKRVARILFFKIRPSQKILKIRDGTPLRGGGNFYIHKKPSQRIVARVLFFKIWSSQGILKVRDCTPMEAEDILTYIKSPRNGSKRVARILFFKIRSSQEILKIRDGTPLEAEEMLTYIKSPRNGSVCYFSSKLDVTGNVVQKKRVARILFFKIRPSQEILKIRDGTPLEAEEILTYIKCPRNGSVCYFSSKLDVSSNVVQKKRVARILFFKIRPSQEILKIRDGTPMEEMLTYIKSPRNGSVCYFSSKLDVPSNVVQKKRVARILFFKIRPSQEILKIRDGTPLEAEEILTYIKCPRNGSVCYFSSKLDVSSNVVQKKRVARILFFKIRPSQEILKIRDGTPMEAE